MYEQTIAGMRETEDVNTHHLLQQHLYKSRKQVSIFIRITTHYINNRNRLKGDHILFKHAVSIIQVILRLLPRDKNKLLCFVVLVSDL